MKIRSALYAACVALIACPIYGREFVLTDTATGVHLDNWSISSTDLGIYTMPPFSVQKRTLHGGRQEGVEIMQVDNGVLKFYLIPTRGMSIYKVEGQGMSLGWDSPVKEIVNPAYVNLQSRNGRGLVEGFNEFLVRCGVEWAGSAGFDGGNFLSIHGLIGSTPASKVIVDIDERPPFKIRVRGLVLEQAFKFSDYALWTEFSTELHGTSFKISDTLVNQSDYEQEYQMIYHSNFGPPLLEKGSHFVAAVSQVAPFDAAAAKDVSNWTVYQGPTKNFGEEVFLVKPVVKKDGTTTVMLENSAGDRGIRLDYDATSLPFFSLWKNTDTLKQGYVTGLEPSTGFPYNRAVERAHGRVPKLAPGASCTFALDYSILFDRQHVEETRKAIAQLQGSTQISVKAAPEK